MQTSRGLDFSLAPARRSDRDRATAIVFHHGIGTNREIWADWLPVLEERWTTARFDVRGFGASVVPPAGHAWTFDELVDDLLEVATLAGSGAPVHLVGESLGGTVVLLAAIRYPDRVASVTVSNTAFRGGGINRVAGWREEIEREGIAGWADRMMELRFAPGVLSGPRRAWFDAEQRRGHAHVVIGLGEMLAMADLTPGLQHLKAPLLILMPDQSPFVPLAQAQELAERVAGAELEVYPGVRHGLPWSHAAVCAARLASFLTRLEARD